MDYKEYFNQLESILLPYKDIWNKEILLEYPNHHAPYQKKWTDELKNLNLDELYHFEKKSYKNLRLSTELFELVNSLDQISLIPQKIFPSKLKEKHYDHYAFLFQIPKKVHEIKNLSLAIDDLAQTVHVKKITDIGGGVGFLAQNLTNYFNYEVTSIDADESLQIAGKKRNSKNTKNPENMINFVHHFVSIQNVDKNFNSNFSFDSLSCGLHTCGGLAVDHLKLATKNNNIALINLGCCYHKLSKNSDLQNISDFYKKHSSLTLSPYALTLATRGHKKLTLKDFHFKNIVKKYRYTLHLYLYHKLGICDFVSLGTSHPKLYQGDFASYAINQLTKLNLKLPSNQELNDFYEDKKISESVWELILLGVLRAHFGRALEVYLLLDRVFYLEENNYKTQLFALFDEEISPRNIAISATKKTL